MHMHSKSVASKLLHYPDAWCGLGSTALYSSLPKKDKKKNMERMLVNEGADITAADMVLPEIDSELVKFYKDKTIFLTGASGFVGQLYVEKLLRTCPDLRKIYILLRPKKGKDAQTRFREIFNGPNFEPLKRKYPNFEEKLHLVHGDISQLQLGLDDSDKELLINETNCVLHCAATVRFDEQLRTAALINIRSVMEVVAMAKQMRNLKALLYVSTAYSHCVQKTIDEKFYEPPMEAEKLFSLLESLPDDKINAITPVILGTFPNTYVFTKAIAESVVNASARNLPAGVIRPSIIIASVKEPLAGWIDNLYGATGVLVGAALGVLRTLHGKGENIAELIPVDYVVNCTLAALWDIAETKSKDDNREDESESVEDDGGVPTVYNCVSSPESPINWNSFTSLASKHCVGIESPLIVWHGIFRMHETRIGHLLAVFFLHTVPAYIVDFFAMCLGRERMMVKGYKKINKFLKVINYFSIREWRFGNDNVKKLWRKLNVRDRELFEFSMEHFDWDAFFFTYVRGLRIYLLKDPLETIPEGKKKYFRVMVAHYCLVTFLVFLLYKVVMWIFGGFM